MKDKKIIIVGAGFTGLIIALELTKLGYNVKVFDESNQIGGLASSFNVGEYSLEKFYHHWFNNDKDIIKLIHDLGESDKIKRNFSRTGMYYANSFFKLSSPLDLLRLKALPFWSRIRLGIGTLFVQNISNWKSLEKHRAIDWLPRVFGKTAYEVIWKPLLIGKFGDKHQDVSAVWFWNKISIMITRYPNSILV